MLEWIFAKSVLLPLLAALAVGAGIYAIVRNWPLIRETFFSVFRPWIEEKAGEKIAKLCELVFLKLDDNVALIRRLNKQIKKLLNVIICKYEVRIKKKNAYQAQIIQRQWLRAKDGTYHERQVTETVDMKDLDEDVADQIREREISIDMLEETRKRVDEIQQEND